MYCAIEHLHRDPAVAAAVRAGRFTHGGLTLELGIEPDWRSPLLPEDDEWRIEWSKFYFGLDLASAHAVTGDDSFRSTWERLVRSWIEQVPIEADTADVTARRVQNWLYAWQLFESGASVQGFESDFEEALVTSLAGQADHIRSNLTAARNHRTLELYALFVLPLALPELDGDGELLAFAVEAMYEDLQAAFRVDGVHREASSHYHMIVLRSFLGARENARRFGVPLPAGYDRLLEPACDFALHAHRPDGGIPALSDSDGGSYADVLALAGRLLGRDDLRYVATAGRAGTPPRHSSASFPDGGYYFQRSGWGEGQSRFGDERFLVLDCGPLGDGGHGHYDLLSIELGAGGRALVVDPGRYTYSEEGENLRRWFKGTQAHNTVVVDGLDQTPYRRGKPRGAVAQGRFLGRLSVDGLDVLSAVATSPAYDAVHLRRVAFVAGEYWVIEDKLFGNEAHRFDLRFHLAPEAWRTTVVDGGAVVAPGVALVFAPPVRPELEAGWVSHTYGVKRRAPVVTAVLEDVREAAFVTLVFPRDPGSPVPTLSVGHEATGETVIEVNRLGTGRGARDRVVLGEDAASFVRSVERRT